MLLCAVEFNQPVYTNFAGSLFNAITERFGALFLDA